MTSLVLAYLLWFTFGFTGLHHLYLRRPYHAFAWFISGGGFVLGTLWDLCELPNYVDECRHWGQYVRECHQGSRRQPKCSTARFVGQICIGSWLGVVALVAVPHAWWSDFSLSIWSTCFCALAIAWGVHIVGNIGLQERQFGTSSAVSVAVCLATFWYFESANGVLYAACASAYAANRTVRWRRTETQKSNRIFFACCFLYCSLLLCSFYNNGQMYYNGKLRPVPEAYQEFREHFEFREFVAEIFVLSEYFEKTAVNIMLTDVLMVFKNILLIHTVANPREIDEAYDIIGVSRYSSVKQIRTECRKLLKRHHPDITGKSDDEQFIKIHQACQVLIKM